MSAPAHEPLASDDAPPSRGRWSGTFSRIAGAAASRRARTADAPPIGPTIRLRSRLAFVEAAILTAAMPLLGYVTERADPLFLRSAFAWTALAPLVIGLRHGLLPAVASAAALDGLVLVAWKASWPGTETLPSGALIGLMAVALLAGRFSDAWKREAATLERTLGERTRRLRDILRQRVLLELSHDRLEERLARETSTLRDAVVSVARLAESRRGASLEDVAGPVLELFAAHTMVEIASLHEVEHGALVRHPAGTLGAPRPVDLDDPILQEALRTRRLAFAPPFAPEAREARLHQGLLAAVPLVDTQDELRGVLCVESMPLAALERRNLGAIAIVAGHVADVLSGAGEPLDRVCGDRARFERRLERALRDLEEGDLSSAVLAISIRGGPARTLVEAVLGVALRAVDTALVARDREGHHTVLVLLPLSGEEGAQAVGRRIDDVVRRELGAAPAAPGLSYVVRALREGDTVESMLRQLSPKTRSNHAAAERPALL